MYDSENGNKLISAVGEYPVIDGDQIYFSGKELLAAELKPDNKLDTLWNKNISASNDLIKAGNCLFAADSAGISAIKLLAGNKTEVIWNYQTDKNIERLVAANGKLIAVSTDGTMMIFGDTPVEQVADL